MKEIIFLNDRFIPQEEAKGVLTGGQLYGWGLFETMRVYKSKIVYFDAHLERLKNSSKTIGLNSGYSAPKLKGIIGKIIKLSALKDIYIRLTLYKNKEATNTLIIARGYKPYPLQKYGRGFSVQVSRFRQIAGSILARIKTTSRLLYELSFQEAQEKGFDEAIILDTYGYITEGARSNIFLIKDKEIFTPALKCGCLEGITRRVILDLAKKHGIKAQEGKFSLQDLYGADEAFLTNSLMGVMPLTRIEKKYIGKSTNALTRLFAQRYNRILYEV